MSEETLSEALSKLDNEDDINRAALPPGRRVEEEVQEEDAIIELSEEEVEDLAPITDDSIQEDFEAAEPNTEEELSEAEVKARTAQNRINQAVKQAKEYQRRELQALQYAKEIQAQNDALANQLKNTQTSSAEQNLKIQQSYSQEMENRVETQAQAAKRGLKTAYESGDPEAMAEAQQLLARAEADRNALAKYRQDLSEYKVQYDAWLDQQSQQVEQSQQIDFTPTEQPVYEEPSMRAQEWASSNEWFGTDSVMTNVAFAIHNELQGSGIDLESDEYYSQIDKRMREELPHKFPAGGKQQPVQTVVSNTRITGSGRNQNNREVRLNPSEQQLARKLGVPFKEYAKQKRRLERS
tara:strand:- start:399 stop:1457 length:1059 start_codon:yes stop_codon:yes gene_type:complete